MGASLSFYIHKNNPTRQDIQEHFNGVIQEQKNDPDGDGYSGDLVEKSSLKILDDNVFLDFKSALKALENNDKYHPAWAIPFKGVVDEPMARLKKALSSQEKAKKEHEEQIKKVIREIQTGKSQNVRCKTCKSQFNRKMINSIHCKSCGKSEGGIMTAAQSKLIQSKINKITAATLRVGKTSHLTKKTTGINYIVGGFCPE